MRARLDLRPVIRPRTALALALGLAVLAGAACAGGGTFALSAEDNSPAAIARALDLEKKPAAGTPLNPGGTPMAYLVASGKPRKLIAWDLVAGKAAWTVEADVTSRIAVGSTLIAHREGKDTIVARAIGDGHKLWSHRLGGRATFLGLAADGPRVFLAVQDDSGKRTWHLIALQDGDEIWRSGAPGTLGAPAARGGLVFMPFMTQWLVILDAASGQQIARIRQTDEAVNFVRTTSEGVYYGSKGVFRLDERSAAGTRGGASYLAAKLPAFVRTFYHYDAFQAVQAEYSAFDRNRILWRAAAPGDLAFRDGLVTVFTYRFFFGFDAASGDLRWAHHHPRFDVVAAEHTGASIVYMSQEGELGVLDPVTGAQLALSRVGTRVLGATFDADGFRPAGGELLPVNTHQALASIIFDKDARFNAQKTFAVEVLASLPGAETTLALLAILNDDGVPTAIHGKAAEVLVARKDPEGLPYLVEALKVKPDFLAGTKPRAVDVIARTIGAIARPEGAIPLVAHLDSPGTPLAAVKDIADALAACGNREVIPELRAYLLVYRADPAFSSDTAPIAAVIEALLSLGAGGERELVAFVAEDPRTEPKVAEYARRALTQVRPVAKGEGR